MSRIILYIGPSGCGKTTSIRNLDPESTYLISIINKDLPFKNWKSKYFETQGETQGNRKVIFKTACSSEAMKKNPKLFMEASETVCKTMKLISERLTHIKTIIIDDSQYLMSYEFMARAREKGYEKFNEIGQNFFNILTTAQELRDDITVVFLHHSEVSDGILKAKTIGKMLDEKVTVEGLFTNVLLGQSRKANGKLEYYVITNSDGTSTSKSPMEQLDFEEPNDLQLILDKITAYNS